MAQPTETDEDGLTPLEQAIAKRLYERWADDSGEMTIRTDPRDVALHLRPVLPRSAPAPVSQSEIVKVLRKHQHCAEMFTPGAFIDHLAAAVADHLEGL